jgi:hypothetical protein
MHVKLNNPTPFAALQFESVDAKRNHFGVVVVRGAFRIENGIRLKPLERQVPLVLEDSYFGDHGSSSIRFAHSLAPYKPKTDVLIEATAYSPDGRPRTDWISEVHLGERVRRFRVTGPRKWEKDIFGRKASAPQPISRLDIRYEHAFGGTSADGQTTFPGNPLGVGFDTTPGAKFPQIVPADFDLHETGPVPVVGLGPIGPGWQPRLGFAGTFDAKWQSETAPYLPEDFDFEHHNVAPAGMRVTHFVDGDEVIGLRNLYSKGDLSFGLPGIYFSNVLRFKGGRIVPGPMNLDTIEIQVERQLVFLQWRGIFPKNLPIIQVDLRMAAPEFLIAAREA